MKIENLLDLKIFLSKFPDELLITKPAIVQGEECFTTICTAETLVEDYYRDENDNENVGPLSLVQEYAEDFDIENFTKVASKGDPILYEII